MKHNITGETTILIHAGKQAVWNALTNPAVIKQYFFGTETYTTWQTGSPVTFKGEWQGKKYEDKGAVLENIDGEKLKYTYWSSMSGIEDLPGNYMIVSYLLKAKDENNTELTIRLENIPDEKTRDHSMQNWQSVMHGLKQLVEVE